MFGNGIYVHWQGTLLEGCVSHTYVKVNNVLPNITRNKWEEPSIIGDPNSYMSLFFGFLHYITQGGAPAPPFFSLVHSPWSYKPTSRTTPRHRAYQKMADTPQDETQEQRGDINVHLATVDPDASGVTSKKHSKNQLHTSVSSKNTHLNGSKLSQPYQFYFTFTIRHVGGLRPFQAIPGLHDVEAALPPGQAPPCDDISGFSSWGYPEDLGNFQLGVEPQFVSVQLVYKYYFTRVD